MNISFYESEQFNLCRREPVHIVDPLQGHVTSGHVLATVKLHCLCGLIRYYILERITNWVWYGSCWGYRHNKLGNLKCILDIFYQ